MKYYYKNLGFGMKESLNAFLRSQNKDPSTIWNQIEEAIRTVVLAKEPLILEVLNRLVIICTTLAKLYRQNFLSF